MSTHHVVLIILVAGVAAPLLAELPLGFRVPVVIIELLLGVLIGPHALGLVRFDGFLVPMFTYGMACSLFMAGMELDFERIRGRPLFLALQGWMVSLLIAGGAAWLLHAMPGLRAPMSVCLALATTGLGVLLPVFRDGGVLETQFGRMVLAAGTVGEVGPIVAMSLLLSTAYSTWQEMGFLVTFLAIVGAAAFFGTRSTLPWILGLLSRTMRGSTQLPVRLSLLVLAALFVISEEFGFESIFGAFAAGMVVGLATRGEQGRPLREKIDAVTFGWFYPFFFVGVGIKLDLPALTRDLTTMLLVPGFVVLFLVVRGAPTLLYRRELGPAEHWPFALSTAVPSVSIIVVITEVGTRARTMNSDVSGALVGAGALATLLFPTIASALLSRRASSHPKPT